MSDLISRQMAIDVVGDWIYNPEDLRYHKDVINSIPAAQPDHIAESDRKVSVSCGQENDLISRKAAIEFIRECVEVAHDNYEWDMEQGYLNAIECVEEVPSAQPEIIRCKDCKYMIDTGDDLMCDNAKGWVVATASDFGCVLAERRSE